MNLFTKHKWSHRYGKQAYSYQGGKRRCTGRLELACTLLCMKGSLMGTDYIHSVLWWPRWEGNLKKRGSIHTYN